MRIGFDGGCLANRRGFGRYAREVLKALAAKARGRGHEVVVLVDRPSLGAIELPADCEVRAVDVAEAPSAAAAGEGRRRIGDLLAMGRAAARARLDLLYFPASYSYFPSWNAGRVVVTLHDAIALDRPEWVFPTARARWLWAIKERLAVATASRIVTTTLFARDAIARRYRLDPRTIPVVGAGADPIFRPTRPGAESAAVLSRHGIDPSRPFLLHVGGFSPHKNLPRLVEAFARLDAPGLRLVLAGDLAADGFHSGSAEVLATIARLGVGDRVVLPGFVADRDLVWLYGASYALVFPSLMEGFGLPAVEAMACGTPVLASLSGSLPEVVGPAGRLFEPTDVESIAACLRTFLADPDARDRLAMRAIGRAACYSWGRTADALLDAFERTAGPAGRGPRLTSRPSSASRGSSRSGGPDDSCGTRPSRRVASSRHGG